MDQIPWWQSRAIWSSVISVGIGLANGAGKQISPDLQGSILDTVMQIVTVVTGISALYYRVKATKQISPQVLPAALTKGTKS